MKSAWSRAGELAASTPQSRNRYVDFLRAAAILCVVAGHWLAAAPYVDGTGKLQATHILAVADWTHWLTWAIQVMPVFFMVGGFSNGLTWRAAQRDGVAYHAWLDARLRRLVWPVVPLLVVWVALGIAAHLGGVRPEMVKIGSQMALIPTWFLAVYVGVAALVPITHAMWERWGFASFWAFVAAAVLVDVLFFQANLRALGWVNYLLVWSAVHQLGYAWGDGRLRNGKLGLLYFAIGLLLLLALTRYGPYPRAMVGVPGEPISNTSPPKITLLALAVMQGGLLLSLQAAARRWLSRAAPWTATILVNGMIMTIYLWHLTAMLFVIALSSAVGGVGLRVDPGSGAWWATRPLWHAVLAIALFPLVLMFGRFERPKSRTGSSPRATRLLAGAALVCAGLALLALGGVGGDGPLGLRPVVLGITFAGAALILAPASHEPRSR
ncbi:MAG: acyltransferase family protein [Planctomycetota bacterium]